MKTSTLATLALVLLSLHSPMHAQWIQTYGPNGGYVNTIADSGTNLFAGTVGGVFLSTNSGATWTPVNTGMPGITVYALAVCGTNLFAGTIVGVFLSTNSGATWTPVNKGIPSC